MILNYSDLPSLISFPQQNKKNIDVQFAQSEIYYPVAF